MNQLDKAVGGGNEELNADGDKSIKLLKFIWQGFLSSNT